MSEEIIKLQDLIIKSNKVDFVTDTIENVLPGKYIVLKHITNESKTRREGNLFIIHEDFADENIPLYEYSWKEGISFDYEDKFLTIADANYQPKMNTKEVNEIFGDDMMAVIDNQVCFSMACSDYGYVCNILKEGEKIIGFNVEGIGSVINTPNVQLHVACQKGDLQAVRNLLNHPEAEKRATLDYKAFYFACTNSCKEVIAYLMSSPELSEHSKINNKEDKRFTTPFTILCHQHPEIVQDFILTFPDAAFNDIKDFLANPKNLSLNREILIDTVEKREQLINKELINNIKKIKF